MEFEKCIFTYKVGDIFFEDTKDPINNFWQIIDCKETVVRTLKNDAVREQKKINLVIAHIGIKPLILMQRGDTEKSNPFKMALHRLFATINNQIKF